MLERDRIWVRDTNIWSSAGVSAGVDLTLALIEHDHGLKIALRVARELVVFLKRPVGNPSSVPYFQDRWPTPGGLLSHYSGGSPTISTPTSAPKYLQKERG